MGGFVRSCRASSGLLAFTDRSVSESELPRYVSVPSYIGEVVCRGGMDTMAVPSDLFCYLRMIIYLYIHLYITASTVH